MFDQNCLLSTAEIEASKVRWTALSRHEILI